MKDIECDYGHGYKGERDSNPTARKKVQKKTIWNRGYDYITRMSDNGIYKYNITECRIAAMAYEAGWKAAKRNKN